jgi:hypothetical protein
MMMADAAGFCARKQSSCPPLNNGGSHDSPMIGDVPCMRNAPGSPAAVADAISTASCAAPLSSCASALSMLSGRRSVALLPLPWI